MDKNFKQVPKSSTGRMFDGGWRKNAHGSDTEE